MDELILKINLQLFAEPEDEGRTEQPTEKKLREAREKGKVAKTTELGSALVLFVIFLMLFFMSKTILGTLMDFMKGIFNNLDKFSISNDSYKNVVMAGVISLFKILFPIMGVAVFIAFLSDVIQIGFKFTLEPIKPKLSKISFTVEKLRQRFLFSRYMLINLSKSILKIVIIVVIAFIILKANYKTILDTIQMSLLSSVGVLGKISFKMIILVCIVMLVFTLVDYLYQRWEHIRSLKMTLYELKEELKEYEMNPQVRAKQREMMRQLVVMRRMFQEVPKADVVITNPTHYAVALIYDELEMEAPEVVAKGKDLIAKEIKNVAEKNDVPIIENPPLARTLYNEVEIGDEIPIELFEAVVEVYKIIYEMKKGRQIKYG